MGTSLACRLPWGCGFALCSFPEHAVSWQLMFACSPCQGHGSLKKANNKPKMLAEGDGVNAGPLARCQEWYGVAHVACSCVQGLSGACFIPPKIAAGLGAGMRPL